MRVGCGIRQGSNHCFTGPQTFTKILIIVAFIEMNHLLQELGDSLVEYFG